MPVPVLPADTVLPVDTVEPYYAPQYLDGFPSAAQGDSV